MFLAHSFRLRDPWQCEPVADGGVRWSRVFHRPTGLEADDALWLVISGLPAGTVVSLNGRCVATVSPAAPCQCDVTQLLADANRIEIAVALAQAAAMSQFPYDARLGVMATR